MINKNDFKKINDYLWEIPRSFRSDMKVPARIYVDEKMLDSIEPDAIDQVVNVATLPGIINYSLAMPDIHTGYGFVIGGVAAMDAKNGVISPGGVGFDINCGMKLLRSEHSEKEIKPHLEKLANGIQEEVPSGLGRGRQIKLSIEQIDRILERGARHLVKNGYGEKEDIENCEAGGYIEQADASMVSSHAKNRGRDQVGTLGSGNHFVEVQKVDEIFDEEIAKKFGLFKNQVVIMIHTGSRGLGHQIATDYIRVMMQAMPKYNIKVPDRQLACAPLDSPEGQRYFKAMSAGANYAWANRQMITHYVRKVWKGKLTAVYDVAHNIAKVESELVVHRKGATRAFPDQPVLIPGSMGTASYVLVGTEQGKEAWFSTCHGAGRRMSRHAAMRAITGQEVVRNLEQKGILIKCRSMQGIAEEAPLAYKDIDNVVEVVHRAGLSKKVARLVPLAVIKGE